MVTWEARFNDDREGYYGRDGEGLACGLGFNTRFKFTNASYTASVLFFFFFLKGGKPFFPLLCPSS